MPYSTDSRRIPADVSTLAPEKSASPSADAGADVAPPASDLGAAEIGGPAGPEPTRFGDWEKQGRCIDF